MNRELEPIWNAILEVYDVFAKVCNDHGLRYYVAYGTALGAVRHHGFIPWDDDLDVIMPRPDYDKFRTMQKEWLPAHLKFVDWQNTKELTTCTYSKIQDARRIKVDDLERKVQRKLPHGIYIDIFPIDGAPTGRLERWYYRTMLRLLKLSFSSFERHSSDYRRIRSIVAQLIGITARKLIFKVSKPSDLAWRYEALSRRKAFCADNECGCIISPYGIFHGLCDYSVYGNPVYMQFQGRKVPVPEKYHKYLTALYGDYMVLPPVEKRVSWHEDLDTAPWRFGPTLKG